MPPLFGFFPVCVFFLSLILVGIIMYLAGAGAADPADAADPVAADPSPRPPYWVSLAVLLAAVAFLLLLSLVTDG